ncbi:MAG: FlgD immunoglobulin-like domain containing protein [Candidatus Krumholzibacteriia bacterium]
MTRPVVLLWLACSVIVATAIPGLSRAKKIAPVERPRFVSPPAPAVLPPDLRDSGSPMLSTAAPDTFHLAWFDFDTGGLPDTQGWTSADLTAQLDEFFHVADATDLDGGDFGRLIVLEGAQSLWCGTPASTAEPFCGWATLPGYGNRWDQRFTSKIFTGCDSVRISYKVMWDSEPGYDQTTVEYFDDATGNWVDFPVRGGVGYYDGWPSTGATVDSLVAQVGISTTQIRFHFTSDGAWSDQDGMWPTDGAVIFDSVSVDCYSGGAVTESYFEDFEGEAPGSRVTDDGVWTATPSPSYGRFADLYPGVGVLQEDPCVTATTAVWGWFDDPVNTNYACHTPDPRPDVGAVPYGNAEGLYLDNAIWSPRIPFAGSGSKVFFVEKVYRDQALDNLIFYSLDMRSYVTGCAERWERIEHTIYGNQKTWLTRAWSVGHAVDPGALELQFQIRVWDGCAFWCNIFGTGQCHGHAPLWDSIHVIRVDDNGPQFIVRHFDLFQDNFADDGTPTGTARADAANDIMPSNNPAILPGDSITITLNDPEAGLGTDAFTGVGPAAYVYATVLPPNQPGKSGANLEAPESRTAGKRYPLVDSLLQGGVQWYCFRMDTAFTSSGFPMSDRFCFDLNDGVFTPGDTILYVLAAENTALQTNYFSRRMNGQGDDFLTGDQAEALNSPMEFTILPAGGWLRGGSILYVDDTDDRGGPAQMFFDTAFSQFGSVGNLSLVDRYDVLAPASAVGNSLASRVANVAGQIMAPYRTIIWNSGDLSTGLLGDGGAPNGGGSPEKADDYALLFQFLDTHSNNPGLYVSGDDVASDWAALTGLAAVNTRSTYMNFNLDPAAPDGSHVTAGEPISPTLDAVGPIGSATSDQLVAYGGCPVINDFDLLVPAGSSVAEFSDLATGKTYVLSNSTPNSGGSTARVVLSGFSYHYIRDTGVPGTVLARITHLQHVLEWLQNLVVIGSGIDDIPSLVNRLEPNYPNPFNPVTTIRYAIKERGHVSLRIYNAAGQLVRTLVNEVQTPLAGGFETTWDGRNNAGQFVSSGVYFYKMVAGGFSQTRKMVLLK